MSSVFVRGRVAGSHRLLWLTMRFSGVILRVLRPSSVELSTRIAGLLLSAIAVQLIVEAIKTFVTNG